MTAVSPVAAELPLPGGQEGATVRLHPLLTGELLAPPGLLARERPFPMLRGLGVGVPRERWVWIPVPAFLIEHPGAGALLVDTGLPSSAATDPGPEMGRIAMRLYDFRVTADQPAVAQVRARGVDPAEVRYLLMSHLHLDHACAVREFPGAQFLVDRREWRAAHAPTRLMGGYNRRQYDHPVDWRTVDYESPAAEAFGPFEHTIDLFGDGSVRLVSTPGHSLGHQSVLLRLRDRQALLAVDAAYTMRGIRDSVMPGLWAKPKLFKHSLAQIQAFARDEPDALIVSGHDPESWPALESVYE